MAAGDKKSSGQRFTPPPATLWNAMVAAGESHLSGQLSQQRGPQHRQRDANRIKCRNDSGADRKRGEILGAFTNPLTGLHADDLRLAGDEPGEDDHFGILLKATPAGEYGDLQVSGACLALVDVTDADHTRARADGSGHVLVSADDGPIEILYKPEGTGEELCCVRFGGGGGGARMVRFGLTASLASGTASADFIEMEGSEIGTDTLRDPEGIFNTLGDGDRGLAMYQGGKYWIHQADCPAEDE